MLPDYATPQQCQLKVHFVKALTSERAYSLTDAKRQKQEQASPFYSMEIAKKEVRIQYHGSPHHGGLRPPIFIFMGVNMLMDRRF